MSSGSTRRRSYILTYLNIRRSLTCPSMLKSRNKPNWFGPRHWKSAELVWEPIEMPSSSKWVRETLKSKRRSKILAQKRSRRGFSDAFVSWERLPMRSSRPLLLWMSKTRHLMILWTSRSWMRLSCSPHRQMRARSQTASERHAYLIRCLGSPIKRGKTLRHPSLTQGSLMVLWRWMRQWTSRVLVWIEI